MDVIQLLITIVVVTILVTIVLAVVTYVAYKLRLSREPSALERAVGEGPRYFVRYDPRGAAEPADPGSEVATAAAATSEPEGHAT